LRTASPPFRDPRLELDRHAPPVTAPHQVEVGRVGIRVVGVVRIQEWWLPVADIVHADIHTRVDRLDVLAELDIVVDRRAEIEEQAWIEQWLP
jgi:hypothetical protein